MHMRALSALLLAAYGAFLIKVMVLKDLPLVRIGTLMLNFGGTDAGHAPNFVPLATIVPYLIGYKGLIIAGINIVGNIALLMPLGFLVPLVWPGITWKKSLILAIASGLSIEVLQVVLRVGIFDIDDVILNTLGFMLGFWILAGLVKAARSMGQRNALVAAIIGIVIAAGVGFAAYQKYPVSLEPAPISGEQTLGGGQGGDLCGGTGGNGQILSVSGSSFVLEFNEGRSQTINLADKAEIHTPAGPGTVSELKPGDRLTLVGGPNPDGSFTAGAVFVCTP